MAPAPLHCKQTIRLSNRLQTYDRAGPIGLINSHNNMWIAYDYLIYLEKNMTI